jgi:hypothetical protein
MSGLLYISAMETMAPGTKYLFETEQYERNKKTVIKWAI